MKNKVELKKYLRITLFISIFLLIFWLIINIYEYNVYTSNFNEKINQIIGVLNEKYPLLTETEIIEILNNDNVRSSNILNKYGIDIQKQSILEKNDKAGICAPKMVDSNQKLVRRSSWKIRKPAIDMVNSTRLTEVLLWWLLRKGEYNLKDFEKPELKVEAVSGAFFVIKTKIFEKCDFFDENTFLFYEEDILASKIKKLGYEEYSLNDISFTHYESQTIDKAYNYFKKVKMLQKSKMYYQKNYNNINFLQILIFNLLNLWRKLELIIEVPIRKFMKK